MNWTKIPTNLILDNIPDKDILAVVKYQLLWAALEHRPDDRAALCHMSANQLRIARQYLASISTQVSIDIDSCNNHRSRQKTYYTKKQSLTQNYDGHTDGHTDGHADGIDKIRLDKIRKESTPQTPLNKFSPPTLQEVLTFAKQQNDVAKTGGFPCSKAIAEEFWSHYQANGWIVGNESRTPVRDWQAKLRQWCVRESQKEMQC